MKTRDEYVAKLKQQLDQWNTEVGKWEAQAKSAKQDLKERSEKELAVLKAQRELAMYNLKLLEGASATAWTELRKGADEAWGRMQTALADARTHFEKRS
jgi:multidrug resistance efflux pump